MMLCRIVYKVFTQLRRYTVIIVWGAMINYIASMRPRAALVRIALSMTLVTNAGLALFGQQANLSGRVVDGSQLAVSGAAVAIKSEATDLKRSTTSNDSGLYTLPSLPPGKYDITVTASGFESLERKGLLLEVAQQAQVDFALQVGKMSEIVNVSGGSDLLQTSDASVGTVVDRELTDNMPLNGRSF
jgi:hypothetical protein